MHSQTTTSHLNSAIGETTMLLPMSLACEVPVSASEPEDVNFLSRQFVVESHRTPSASLGSAPPTGRSGLFPNNNKSPEFRDQGNNNAAPYREPVSSSEPEGVNLEVAIVGASRG